MRSPLSLTLLGLAALLLTACDKTPSGAPPTPTTRTSMSTGTGAAPSIPADPSMPSAAVIASASSSGPVAPVQQPGRTNSDLTTRQEISGMPVAGQNNDHSAPLASAEAASAPRQAR